MKKTPIVFRISPTTVGWAMGIIITILLVLHLAGRYIRFVLGYDFAFGFVPMFNMGLENNFPTLYSSSAILLASILCLIIGLAYRRSERRFAFHWLGLALALLFAAVDEILELHEKLNSPMQQLFNTTGLLHHAWIIPYSVLSLFGGVVYWRFLLELPKQLRNCLIYAASIYLIGAIGLEAIAGLVVTSIGVVNFYHLALLTVEETMEMIGILILVLGLFRYIESEYGGLQIVLARE